MLQRLPTVPAKIKAVDTSENLSKEIHQLTFSLYQVK